MILLDRPNGPAPARARAVIGGARGFLFDMDGVLRVGERPIAATRRFIRALDRRAIPWLVATNRSCRGRDELARELARIGFPVDAARIVTSADATAAWLAARGHARVYAVGERGLRAALRRRGIAHDEVAPRAVVVGLDRRVGFAALASAHRWLLRGLPFVATNPDATAPGADGSEPECGMLLAALRATTGRRPRVIGKPARAMFAYACAQLGLPPAAVTMVGDRLDTDILGARRAGMRSVLVLTGHAGRPATARAAARPDLVVDDLDAAIGLLRPA